ISEKPTVAWELALRPGEDPRTLRDGEFYGFGYTLTAQGVTGPTRVDAHPSGGVQVVLVKETSRPLIGEMPVTVTGGGDGRKTAQEMGAEVMRRLRAAQRGGKL
ncbi:hypothetical protein ABZV25_13980, partial [Micrococcus luteus]